MTTFAEIKTAIESIRATAAARMAKMVMDAGSIEPTHGVDGRLHAPCDNYVWGDNVYMGGQYLPNHEYDAMVLPCHKVKIKIATNMIESFKSLFPNDSTGKSWSQNGTDVCYFYASVSTREKTELNKLLPESGKKLVLVDEYGEGNSKQWKFNIAPFIKRCVDSFKWDWLERACEMVEFEYPGLPINLETNPKTGKLTIKTPYQGKMVRYHYFDNTIYN